MRLILRVTDGPAKGSRFMLTSGQAAQIGRTEWSDFSLPGDARLAPVHFAVQSGPNGWRAKSVSGAALAINGQPADDAVLRDGDQILAGSSVFSVQIEGVARRAADSNGSAPVEGAAAPPPLAAPVAERASLSPEGKALLTDTQSCDELIAALLAAHLTNDAVRLRVAQLDSASAVRWAIQCACKTLAEPPCPKSKAALDAAQFWADKPTEEHRRAAEKAATDLNHDGPAAFAALAAFWSGDNIAPAGLPAVPTPAGLALQGVSGAVLLSAAAIGPEKMANTLNEFLENSKKLLKNS